MNIDVSSVSKSGRGGLDFRPGSIDWKITKLVLELSLKLGATQSRTSRSDRRRMGSLKDGRLIKNG